MLIEQTVAISNALKYFLSNDVTIYVLLSMQLVNLHMLE